MPHLSDPPDPPDVGPHGFDVTVETHAGHDVVQVTGDLDVYTTGRLREVISEPERCTRPVLILDLVRVGFLDSTGLSAIVSARRLAHARRAELRLVCPRGAAYRVIRLTGLDAVLPVYGTLAEAVAGG